MELLIHECKPDELPKLLQLYQHLHTKDDPLPSSSFLQLVWQEILDDPKIHLLAGEWDGESDAVNRTTGRQDI